jgi:hypothetical protein
MQLPKRIFVPLNSMLATLSKPMSRGFQNLQVIFNGCQPTEVIGHDQSCGNRADPKNKADRKAGPVRWAPSDKIKSITVNPGTPEKALKARKAMTRQGDYQRIVSGNVSGKIAYNVTSTEGCVLDPVIIID